MTLEEIQALCVTYISERAKHGLNREKFDALCKMVRDYIDSGGEIPDWTPPKSNIPPWIVS